MTKKMSYNPNEKNSIIEYAKRLESKTLKQVCHSSIAEHSYSGKGNFGQVLEKFYFGYEPNSKSEPDFSEVGMELKSSPLKKNNNDDYRSKERLVLNIIDYINVVNQDFINSDFYKKNANILLVFYFHEAGYDILDYEIKLVGEWSFPLTDLEIIKRDWETINKKITDGEAHELSESDTFYLGACTKGASAKTVRRQPYCAVLAKQRAYSFKQSYVNHIIASIAGETKEKYGKLITSLSQLEAKSIEEIVIDKFGPYYGKTVEEISEISNIELDISSKNFYSRITNAVLNIELGKKIEEFEKAGIIVKTIRVESKGSIEQSVSFPAFEFEKIYNESWRTSDFKEIIESKFLFIFFKNDGTQYFLEKVKFWSMPDDDIQEVKKVWLKTKCLIQNGNIFKDYGRNKNGDTRLSKKGNPIKLNNLPKISESTVCHVRPHATDSTHTFPLPIIDKKSNATVYSKQCFWLNNTYVRKVIYVK
ncbi:Sau3AI family type II restriction endonuclease [Flavobacterium sp. XS2P39]|uniref:Sau3AI family type II restriction endonuclease n=1 Tax=Flavobacterium sp. XS2P39 TaxID=3401725 RepID=UPI003AAE68F9